MQPLIGKAQAAWADLATVQAGALLLVLAFLIALALSIARGRSLRRDRAAFARDSHQAALRETESRARIQAQADRLELMSDERDELRDALHISRETVEAVRRDLAASHAAAEKEREAAARELALLRELRARLGDGGPQMAQLIAETRTGDAMVTPSGLREISTYAQGIAPSRERVLAGAAGVRPGRAHLVGQAHSAQLAVFAWTLRAENAFLPEQRRRGSQPGALGDAVADARHLLDLGLDGLITDSPDLAVTALRIRRTAVA